MCLSHCLHMDIYFLAPYAFQCMHLANECVFKLTTTNLDVLKYVNNYKNES